MCKEFRDLMDGEELLFLSPEVSFRGLDSSYQRTDIRLILTNENKRYVKTSG